MNKAAKREYRSDCPVNFAVEALGDRWSLIILRDMIFWGKRSFGDFLKSDEKIATNILASRLVYLEAEGLISKQTDPDDKRREVYSVTELGLGLVPMFIEMIAWSASNEAWQLMPHCGTPEQESFVRRVAETIDRSKIAEEVRITVRNGGFVFQGVDRSRVSV